MECSQQDGTGRVRTFTHILSPVRLMVRTSGFHPENSSSTLLSVIADYVGEVPRCAHNAGTWVRVPYPRFSADIR